MKIKIDEDEFYPIYYLSDYGIEIEVSRDEAERYKRISKEWQEMQQELEGLFNKVEKK